MGENIQHNAFYQGLVDHIPDLERACVREGWVLCVPQRVALPPPHKMSLRLLRTHVLVPGPRTAPDRFTTLTGKSVHRVSEKELEIEEGGDQQQQQAKKRVVQILYREEIYVGPCQGDQSYSVFVLSRPLDGGGDVPTFDDGSEVFLEYRSAVEWEARLVEGAPPPLGRELGASLERLSKTLSALDPAQLVLAQPSSSSSKKAVEPLGYVLCCDFARTAYDMVIQRDERYAMAQQNTKFRAILFTALETCAAANTYAVVFSALAEINNPTENDLQVRLHDLRHIVFVQRKPVERVGLTEALLDKFLEAANTNLAFKSSVEALQNVNDRRCPVEKLWCLRDAGRMLREVEGNTDMDDALPLFLLALISAAPGLLLANLSYMMDFAPRLWMKTSGELAFFCTMLYSAVSLIQEHVLGPSQGEYLLRNLTIAGGSGMGFRWAPIPLPPPPPPPPPAAGASRGLPPPNSSSSTSWLQTCMPESRSG